MSYFKEFKGFDVGRLRDAAVIEIYDIAEDDMYVSINDIYSGTYLLKSVSKENIILTKRDGGQIVLNVSEFVDPYKVGSTEPRMKLKIIK